MTFFHPKTENKDIPKGGSHSVLFHFSHLESLRGSQSCRSWLSCRAELDNNTEVITEDGRTGNLPKGISSNLAISRWQTLTPALSPSPLLCCWLSRLLASVFMSKSSLLPSLSWSPVGGGHCLSAACSPKRWPEVASTRKEVRQRSSEPGCSHTAMQRASVLWGPSSTSLRTSGLATQPAASGMLLAGSNCPERVNAAPLQGRGQAQSLQMWPQLAASLAPPFQNARTTLFTRMGPPPRLPVGMTKKVSEILSQSTPQTN